MWIKLASENNLQNSPKFDSNIFMKTKQEFQNCWIQFTERRFILYFTAHLDYDVIHVTLLHVLVNVGQGPDVERGVGEDSVHPGQAEDGERNVETTNNQHVPVVGGALQTLLLVLEL